MYSCILYEKEALQGKDRELQQKAEEIQGQQDEIKVLTDKNAELEECIQGAKGELDILKAQLHTEAEIKREINEELVGKASQYEQGLDELLDLLEEMKRQHLEAMHTAQTEVDQLQQQTAQLQEDAAAEKERLGEEHKRKLAEIQTLHKSELEKKTIEHQESLSQKFADGKKQGGRPPCFVLPRLACLPARLFITIASHSPAFLSVSASTGEKDLKVKFDEEKVCPLPAWRALMQHDTDAEQMS